MDDYIKQALWETYDKKCFYCREILYFKNIHLDHVIPKILFNRYDASIRSKYNLSLYFNFNSLDNIVPACQSCNSTRKKGKELENGIPLWINEIQMKKEKVNNKSFKLRNELNLDLPDQYKEFFISSPSFMGFNLPIERIRKLDIPYYKEMILYNNFILVGSDNNDEVLVNKLSEYEKYSKKGYYGLSSYAIGMETLCFACLEFFNMLEKATPLKHKLEFKNYVRELPIEILAGTCFEDQFEKIRNYDNIGKFIDLHISEGSNKKVSLLNHKLEIIYSYRYDKSDYEEDYFYLVQEVLQADFTGNGNNEALLFIFYHSGGTMHFTYSHLVKYINNKWYVLS